MKPRIRVRANEPIQLANVTALHAPEPTLVRHYERLLEHARSGRMRSSIEICEWDNGSVSHGHCLAPHAQTRRMLGELTMAMIDTGFVGTRHYFELYPGEIDE